MKKIRYIDEENISGKKVLLRVDLNVSLNPNFSIADDERIRQSIPTIKYLLEKKNKLIIVSHLDRPKQRDPNLSMKVVMDRLKEYLPENKFKLIDDFLTEKKETFDSQKEGEIFVLENIRFYLQEKNTSMTFAKALAALADIYVNDAFAVSHRTETSVVGVPIFIPSYGGLLLKKELTAIDKALNRPKHPMVAIIGGAKISTKIDLIGKLIHKADHVILGGGLANPFFRAKRFSIGKSICEYEMVQKARQLLFTARQKKTEIILPTDALIGDPKNQEKNGIVVKIGDKIPDDMAILDIGPETKARYGTLLAHAKTIIWNGPVGLFENPAYRQGTDFIYYAIAHNNEATSIVGGGDTLAAISKKKYLDKITHISTGGGAMLELIEKGTLPGLEALKR